jgi:hypothetical protein
MEGIHDEEEPVAGKQEEGGDDEEPASPNTVSYTRLHLGPAQALATREANHHELRLYQKVVHAERMLHVGGCRSRSASAKRLLLRRQPPLLASRPRSALLPASSAISQQNSMSILQQGPDSRRMAARKRTPAGRWGPRR